MANTVETISSYGKIPNTFQHLKSPEMSVHMDEYNPNNMPGNNFSSGHYIQNLIQPTISQPGRNDESFPCESDCHSTVSSQQGLLSNPRDPHVNDSSQMDHGTNLFQRLCKSCIWLRYAVLLTVLALLSVSVYLFLKRTDQPPIIPKINPTDSNALPYITTTTKFFTIRKFEIPATTVPKIAPEEQVMNDAPAQEIRERIVSSAKDLKILGGCNKLTIISLTEDLPPKGTRTTSCAQDRKSVKMLDVQGAVTEAWLERLLHDFTSLTDLSVNIYELCIGSTVAKRDTLPKLKIDNIRNLQVTNSNLCPLMNWLLSWQLSNVKTVRISHADFNKGNFPLLVNFLMGNIESLESVIIENSKLCSASVCTFPPEIQPKIKFVNEKFLTDDSYENNDFPQPEIPYDEDDDDIE